MIDLDGYESIEPDIKGIKAGDIVAFEYRPVGGDVSRVAGEVSANNRGALYVGSTLIRYSDGEGTGYARVTKAWRKSPARPLEPLGDHPVVQVGNAMPVVRRAPFEQWFIRTPDAKVWYFVHSPETANSWNQLLRNWGTEYKVLFGTDPRTKEVNK
jgi:hypothetical protein